MLRASGTSIDGAALEDYDAALQLALARCLGGQLDDLSLAQASLGVFEGGLGMRHAATMALPAFVASRVECRWLVQLLAETLSVSSPGAGDLLAAFDAETRAAQEAFEATLDAAGAEQVRALIGEAADARSSPEAALRRRSLRRREASLTGDGLILPAGAEDPELEPDSLQASLCALRDAEAAARLLEQLDAPDLQDRRRCLLELRDPSVSHEWMWRVSRAHGPTVPRSGFQIAVRLRLGAPCACPSAKCTRCGAALSGSHAMRCGLPEATRGHYSVRNDVLALAHLADPSAAVETAGLVPSAPTLRPADIFTSAALPGRLAALDIGISSPDASGAGQDCCDAMFARTLREYGSWLGEMESEGVTYRPMVWSAFGREHPETSAMLEAMAVQAARRRGLRDHRLILRRTRCAIGVRLAARAARMLLCCTPGLAEEEVEALFGAGAGTAEEATVPAHRSVAFDVDGVGVPTSIL